LDDPDEREGGGPITGAAASGSTTDEREYVERAQAGDHQAFRVLVERYQDRAFRLARRVLRDEEAARDAVQEALLKAYGSLGRFQGRSSFYTWLYRLVMNQCIDMKRRDRSDRHVDVPEGDPLELADAEHDPPEVLGVAFAPAAEVMRKELRACLARAIEELPEEHRRTLLLREVDGLSYAEIAKALEVPKGTVMSRLHHARRKVRTFIEASGVLTGEENRGMETR